MNIPSNSRLVWTKIVTTTTNRKIASQNSELSTNQVVGHIHHSSRTSSCFRSSTPGLRACGLLHLRSRQVAAAQGSCQFPLRPLLEQPLAVGRPDENGSGR